jgi:hypothetical protein
MNMVFSPSEAIRVIFAQPARDLVGMVDDLLAVCSEHDLELDWRADGCRVRSRTGDWRDVDDQPLRRSSVRGLLARLAALCNERQPGSCSPYGGQGEIAVGAAVFRLVFTNTPAEQRLQLTRDRRTLPPPSGETLMMPEIGKQTGHPAIAALLAKLPQLQDPDLGGWTQGNLLPALESFQDNASDAELADAMVNLRDVLLHRADVEPWLSPIADQCSIEYVGAPHAMTSAAALKPNIVLSDNRTKNQFTLELVRQLREALRPPVPKKEPSTLPTPASHANRS